MASLHPDNVTKPVDPITEDTIPDATNQHLAEALESLVDHSAKHVDLENSIHAAAHNISRIPFLGRLVPGLEDLAAKYHIGNFVMMRGTNEKFFESMPIYAR
jgi:phosphatidylserine decarboxylase